MSILFGNTYITIIFYVHDLLHLLNCSHNWIYKVTQSMISLNIKYIVGFMSLSDNSWRNKLSRPHDRSHCGAIIQPFSIPHTPSYRTFAPHKEPGRTARSPGHAVPGHAGAVVSLHRGGGRLINTALLLGATRTGAHCHRHCAGKHRHRQSHRRRK